MEFAVSDNIVHPKHGTGQITSVERFDIIDGLERYYVIKMAKKGLIVKVPIRMTDELGIRAVMSSTSLKRVLDVLRSSPDTLPMEFKARRAHVLDKLNTGEAIEIAEAVRDVVWHQKLSRLNKVDIDQLARGRAMLAGEIALVTGSETEEADVMIMSLLTTSMAASPDPINA